MSAKEIALTLAKCVEAVGRELGALDVQVSESKKAVIFSLELRLSRLEFVLTVKGSVLCPPGTLFVRYFPRKNTPLFLHLCELMEEDDFRCTYFPYNTDSSAVERSFSLLCNLLEECRPAMEALTNEEAYQTAVVEKCRRIREDCGISVEHLQQVEGVTPEDVQDYLLTEWGEHYETFCQLLPFTQDEAYAAFVAGKPDRARKKYRRRAEKGKLTPYFARLYAFLSTPEAENFRPLPEDCAGRYTVGRGQQFGTKEGLCLLATAAVCYLPLFLLTVGIHWVLLTLLGQGTAYIPYAPFDFGLMLMLPFPAAFLGAFSLRRWLYPRLFPQNARQWLNQDAMENSHRVNRFCAVLFAVCGVFMVFGAVILALCTPRFYTDRMLLDNGTAFPLIEQVEYRYEDIKAVYHIAGRWNVFDELVERGSYVLVFADGTAIDLDGGVSEADTAENVLPLLTPYIDGITHCPSDRELAAHYGKTPDAFFGYE